MIYPYVYTLCPLLRLYLGITRLIDRVSNEQIKYRLMNGHFSGGKCSRRREAARYIYAEYTPCRRDYYCVRADDGEDGKSIQYLKTYNIYIETIYYIYYYMALRRRRRRLGLCGDRKTPDGKNIIYNNILYYIL